MPRMNKLSTYCTNWEGNPDRGSVTYHQTRVLAWDERSITVDFGGWDSVTTRRKMNQAARQFGLPLAVWREKGVTMVQTPYYCGEAAISIPATFNR